MAKSKSSPTKLTLGPLLFNWPAEQVRDFYFRMADEADYDVVYMGEVVCSKRAPFFEPHAADVIERLQNAGKEIVLSSLALVMSPAENSSLAELCDDGGLMIEANDIAAASWLKGKPHVIGPYVNVYNEDTLAYLADAGATRVCLPAELPGEAVTILAGQGLAEIEVQAFGRLPLALSARCYHARANGLHKDGCQYVCDRDADGLEVETLEHQPFLTVNGTQTMSHTYASLVHEAGHLAEAGVGFFRLSPQSCDMAAVAKIYRDLLSGSHESAAAAAGLDEITGGAEMANGFIRGLEGWTYGNESGSAEAG